MAVSNKIEDNTNFLQTLQSNLSGVFFKGTFNENYSIHSIQDTCKILIGYEESELVSGKIILSDLVHPEDRDALQKSHKEQFQNNQPFVNEFRIICKNGEIKWVKEISTYYISDSNNIVQIDGYVYDITTAKTGVGIANAFTSFQNAVNSGSIVSITDKNGDILFANELFTEVSKYSRNELIGSNHSIINSKFHSKSFFENLWKTVLSGNIWRGQIRNKAKDGSFYWVDTIISPILNEKNEIQQFLSIHNLITEQKEIEYNLRESDALNKSILYSFKTNIIITDEKGLVIKVNDSWEFNDSNNSTFDLMKLSVGDNYFQVLEKAEASGFRDAFKIKRGIEEVLNNTVEVFQLEYPIYLKNGSKWFLLHISKFENEVKRLVFSHFNITERKLQEFKISNNESRLEEAQRIAKIGSWDFDIENNNIVWSGEMYRIYEVPIGGAPITQKMFLSFVHPDERENSEANFIKSIESNQPYTTVHKLLLHNGKIKYVQQQGELIFNELGKPIRLLGTTQDITKQIESEILLENQRIHYENVVENISDGLIIDDIDGNVVFVNKQFLEMIGITEEDLNTFVFDDYVSDEYKKEIRSRHTDRMKGGEVSRIFEYIGLRKDGQRRWFEARVTKIERDNKIIGTQSAIRDITDEKLSIDRLKASEIEKTNLLNELNQRYNELMQFNYIVSHNLRAPIANIMGLAEMFNMEGVDDTEKNQIINHIQFSITKIDELISDLNTILAARSDIHSKKEFVEFAQVIQHIETTLDTQIRESNTKISLDIAKNAQVIFSIKSFIKSTFYNLINNAIKYRSANVTPVIKIAINRNNDNIIITIEDNGIGIDVEKYGKDIFGLYKRFHPTFEGKGLGLNMTKTQVEALGGSISIDSHPGQGSIFTIVLPDKVKSNKN